MIQLYLINLILALASAVIMTVSPFLITEGLGISITVFAFIESVAELLAMFMRFLSGTIFDKIRDKRKIFIISVLFALSGKLFFFFPNALSIFISKICDRISNGLFGAPRDAFLANNAEKKGKAVAVLTSCRSIGCVIGPLVITYTIADSSNIIHKLDVIISFVILIIIIALFTCFFIKDKSGIINTNKKLISLIEFKEIWIYNKQLLITFSLFFFARFTDGMIALNMKQKGLPASIYLSTIAIFNTVMIISSFGFGKLIDKKYLNTAINVTITSLILFNICTLLIDKLPLFFAAISLILWGMQRIGAQTVFVIAINQKLKDNSKLYLYGSALGIESVITGVMNFIGSMIGGYLAFYDIDYIFIFSLIISSTAFIYFNIRTKSM